MDNVAKELVVVQQLTGKMRHYEHVTAHSFDQSTQVLILQTDHGGVQGLQWVDPVSGKQALVWTANAQDSSRIGSYTIDKAGQRLIFTVQRGSPKGTVSSIWYYKKGMAGAVRKEFHDREGKMAPGVERRAGFFR